MQAKAIANGVRVTPRKVEPVLDLIRGKDVGYAQGLLKNLPRSAAEPILKTLNSAVANAENNLELDSRNLFVSKTWVGPSVTLKRMRAASKGRGMRILKRTSNITIILDEKILEDDTDTKGGDK